MAEREKFYITTAISYPNGAPHIGHAYEVVASDAIARFKRHRRLRRLLHDRHRRARPQDPADRRQERQDRKSFRRRHGGEVPRHGRRASTAPTIASSARRTPTTCLRPRSSGAGCRTNGDIYLSKYSGWYSVRDEAYYDESELTQPARREAGSLRPGTPVEWIEEESYFFRLSAYQDRLLAHYEAIPNFISPETRRNEIVSFVRSGLQDLSISRTTFDWGLPVPADPKHVMYVWIDALNNYVTGCGFPDEQRSALALLASRRAHHRQGHRPLPHGLLAGLPDVGRSAAAEARLRARLPVQPRREDVEVGRQRHRPVRAGRRLWRRPAALFLPARSAVRPGRQLFARGDRQPHQRRPRERSRQSRAAVAVDDRARIATAHPGAGRLHPGRSRTSSGWPTRCRSRRRRRCRISRCTRRSPTSGPSWRRRTAISRRRSRGCCASRIRREWRRCST